MKDKRASSRGRGAIEVDPKQLVFKYGLAGGQTLSLARDPLTIFDAKLLVDDALVFLGILPVRHNLLYDRIFLIQKDEVLSEDTPLTSTEEIVVVVNSEAVERGRIASSGVNWIYESTGLPVCFVVPPTTVLEARFMLFYEGGCNFLRPVFTIDGAVIGNDACIKEGQTVIVSFL